MAFLLLFRIRVPWEGAEGDVERLVDVILKEFIKLNSRDSTAFHPRMTIGINFGMPVGVGLGASASLSVTLVRAVKRFFDIELNQEKELEIIQKLEDLNHGGRASGIDHRTIYFNQPMLFEVESQVQVATCTYGMQDFYLINTGKSDESTAEMVVSVAEKFKGKESDMDKIVQEVDDCVDIVGGRSRPTCTCADDIEYSINRAGLLLEQLGVVNERVIEFCNEIRNVDGAAKVSGAGGLTGGSGIVIVMGIEKNNLQELAERFDYELLDM